MLLQETILCATASSSATAAGIISVHDIQSGASLASFKQTNAGPNCVAVFQTHDKYGGFILASQPEKSILNVYNFQKDQIALKIILPEKLTCIALDRRGDFCAGGTAAGRIYLWETASGILNTSWDAHYRQVNVLRFTNDGVALISGSDDSGVGVWSVSRLLDDDMQNEPITPYCTLSDHTLPVTDIVCGIGVFPDYRILTSSVDHSVKIWDLASKSLLTTFHFPKPIVKMAWDLTERYFFAASADGSIHQLNLFRENESKGGGVVMEAIGGAGVTDIIRVDDDQSREERKNRLISVGQPISSLCSSITSTILLVGTSDGLIHLYDIPSHQLLRTISTHKGASISHLETMIKPPDLFGHITLDFAGADFKDLFHVKPVLPFQRMRDLKAREAHEITALLPSHNNVYISDYSTEELLRDQSFFIRPVTGPQISDDDSASVKSKLSEMESEIEELRNQLKTAKVFNDAMWENVVQHIVSEDNSQKTVQDVDERKRKRSRPG